MPDIEKKRATVVANFLNRNPSYRGALKDILGVKAEKVPLELASSPTIDDVKGALRQANSAIAATDEQREAVEHLFSDIQGLYPHEATLATKVARETDAVAKLATAARAQGTQRNWKRAAAIAVVITVVVIGLAIAAWQAVGPIVTKIMQKKEKSEHLVPPAIPPPPPPPTPHAGESEGEGDHVVKGNGGHPSGGKPLATAQSTERFSYKDIDVVNAGGGGKFVPTNFKSSHAAIDCHGSLHDANGQAGDLTVKLNAYVCDHVGGHGSCDSLDGSTNSAKGSPATIAFAHCFQLGEILKPASFALVTDTTDTGHGWKTSSETFSCEGRDACP